MEVLTFSGDAFGFVQLLSTFEIQIRGDDNSWNVNQRNSPEVLKWHRFPSVAIWTRVPYNVLLKRRELIDRSDIRKVPRQSLKLEMFNNSD